MAVEMPSLIAGALGEDSSDDDSRLLCYLPGAG
jgi:hypothetical protein